MNTKETDRKFERHETSRLEAFSDGVFAIAITLLVLDLIEILKPGESKDLLTYYLQNWQPFLAFLIGFITILVCWINHHHVFIYITRVDSNLFWVNGFVLLLITFTPFPTAILAAYLGKQGSPALAIYGFNYFLISVASYCLTFYAFKKSLVRRETRRFFYHLAVLYGYSVVYTLVAFFVCFISNAAAIVLYLILFSVFAFPKEFTAFLMNRSKKK